MPVDEVDQGLHVLVEILPQVEDAQQMHRQRPDEGDCHLTKKEYCVCVCACEQRERESQRERERERRGDTETERPKLAQRRRRRSLSQFHPDLDYPLCFEKPRIARVK